MAPPAPSVAATTALCAWGSMHTPSPGSPHRRRGTPAAGGSSMLSSMVTDLVEGGSPCTASEWRPTGVVALVTTRSEIRPRLPGSNTVEGRSTHDAAGGHPATDRVTNLGLPSVGDATISMPAVP